MQKFHTVLGFRPGLSLRATIELNIIISTYYIYNIAYFGKASCLDWPNDWISSTLGKRLLEPQS